MDRSEIERLEIAPLRQKVLDLEHSLKMEQTKNQKLAKNLRVYKTKS